MTQPPGRLLIVDDEVAQMQALCNTLRIEGYEATGYSSARAALASLQAGQFDLLLTDLMMPEMDGIELLGAVGKVDPHVAGVVMTAHGTIDTAVAAMKVGALDYIVKPFRLNAILAVVARALQMRSLKLENAQLQERERQYIADLEAANRQLETFSFSISHDLRSPLHTICGFCDVYLAQYGGSIPPEGRELLDYVVSGTRRMNQLIEDLLSFCRCGRQPVVKRRVHTGEIVRRAAASLQAAQKDRALELHIGPLPDCDADESLLEQVFTNLLANAFKFTRGRAPAIVEVDSIERDGEVVLRVCDNGAGFDEAHAGKLFGVFERLHSADEFEGTGIGLSIVQQIVMRHGGRIWAQGKPDQGATFFFTLAGTDHEYP